MKPIALISVSFFAAALGFAGIGEGIAAGHPTTVGQPLVKSSPVEFPAALTPALARESGMHHQSGMRGAEYVHRAAASESERTWLRQKVVASDGAALASFGWSVKVSGDTAMISAPSANVNGAATGAVYVFTRTDGSWTQTQKLTPSDGAAGDYFGGRVVFDGSVALIGANTAAVGANAGQGAVYVFVNQDGTWVQVQKLTAGDGAAGDDFGYDIALAGDRALIGAPFATVGENKGQGKAYLFVHSDNGWQQEAKFVADDGGAGDDFGGSVALSGDTVLIGAFWAEAAGVSGQGAVYEFTEGDGGWQQSRKFTSSEVAVNSEFGTQMAVSGDTLVVTAIGVAVDGRALQGAAYVFGKQDGQWVQTQSLVASDGAAFDFFGYSVAMRGDTLAVAAPFSVVDGLTSQGAGYVFRRGNDGVWSQVQKFAAHEGLKSSFFGWSSAVADTTALFGATATPVNGNPNEGASYFYGASDLALAVSAPKHISPGRQFVSQVLVTNAASMTSPAVVVTVAVPAAASFVSANATQGSCSENAGVVSCALGAVAGNAGMATANVTLSAIGDLGATIRNTASVAMAVPALTASGVTAITANNPPVAENGSLTADHDEAANGTLQASDEEGDPLTFSIVDQPMHGTVTITDSTTGAYTYTPTKGYSGDDSFTFKANDGEDDSNVATISVTVKSAPSSGGGGLGWLSLGALLAFVGLSFGLRSFRTVYRRGHPRPS